jgi:molybdenum cofactor cytidylyltransferase
MRAGAVVLAAGASTRLGEPKQLGRLGDENLTERAVRLAREAGCSPVVVVLGAESGRVLSESVLGDALIVINEEWKTGMASSVRRGVETLRVRSDVDGAILMTCDQPAVTAKHLVELMERGEVRASRYAGRNGVPAFFPAERFQDLMSLQGDAGARALLAGAAHVELENGELDVDTPVELLQARALFGE